MQSCQVQKSVFKGHADQFLLHSHTKERTFRKKLRDVKKFCMTFTDFFATWKWPHSFLLCRSQHLWNNFCRWELQTEAFRSRLGEQTHVCISVFWCNAQYKGICGTFWRISSSTKNINIKADKIGDDMVHEMENCVCVHTRWVWRTLVPTPMDHSSSSWLPEHRGWMGNT